MALRRWHIAAGAKTEPGQTHAVKYLWRIRHLFYLGAGFIRLHILMGCIKEKLTVDSVIRVEASFFSYSAYMLLGTCQLKLHLNHKSQDYCNYCCRQNCREPVFLLRLSFKYPDSLFSRYETHFWQAKPQGRNILMKALFVHHLR